jgi:hypothetical protein
VGCGRERKRKGKIEKMVRPTFGGENGGPLGMEVERGNLKNYGKCRSI